MSVSLLDTKLAHWDETECDALIVTFFCDERPLRGAAGLADWRLCGRLSRLIKHRKITGRMHETLLLPPGRKLKFARMILIGLGHSADFDEESFRAHVRVMRDIANRAGIQHYATQAPGRATELIGARRALTLWLEELDADDRNSVKEQIVMIEGPDGQREMAEILRYRNAK